MPTGMSGRKRAAHGSGLEINLSQTKARFSLERPPGGDAWLHGYVANRQWHDRKGRSDAFDHRGQVPVPPRGRSSLPFRLPFADFVGKGRNII